MYGCDSVVYGSLLFRLQRRLLWPSVQASDIQLSVTELAETIAGIVVEVYPESVTAGRTPQRINHVGCKQRCDFKYKVKEVLESAGSPVLVSHLRHMESIAS